MDAAMLLLCLAPTAAAILLMCIAAGTLEICKQISPRFREWIEKQIGLTDDWQEDE